MPGLLVVLVILIAGILIAYHIVDARERRKELAAFAGENGLSFDPEKDRDLDDRHPHLKCLHRGHSRYASNIMRGELGDLEVTAFDYHYVTGHGKNRQTHRHSAVIARSPVPLKPLYIRREHIFDKVGEFFGADDIDFESAEFSRKFYVKAPDKRWAYDVIHQRMMEFLLASPSFSIQFEVDKVVAWKSSRFSGEEFELATEMIKGILDRLPKYLFRR